MGQFEEVLEKYVATKPLNVLIRAYSSYSKQQIYTFIQKALFCYKNWEL